MKNSGRESLFSQFAFAVYPLSSMAVGATLQVAPARDYGHDLDAMRDMLTPQTGVVWVANPNNPTGTRLSHDELRAFVETVPESVIVVIDEAYFEYVRHDDHPDTSQWLADFPNLIVTRTFSKAHGMAGARVGYAIGAAPLASRMLLQGQCATPTPALANIPMSFPSS